MFVNSDLFNLSAAIRRGDIAEAENLIDSIFRLAKHDDAESIQLGRFSRKAQNSDQR